MEYGALHRRIELNLTSIPQMLVKYQAVERSQGPDSILPVYISLESIGTKCSLKLSGPVEMIVISLFGISFVERRRCHGFTFASV